MGKTTLVQNRDECDQAPQATKRDASTRLRHNESGVVDQATPPPTHTRALTDAGSRPGRAGLRICGGGRRESTRGRRSDALRAGDGG